MGSADWDFIEGIALTLMGSTMAQIKKYNRHTTSYTPIPCLNISHTVENLSDSQPAEYENSLLASGNNFAVAPTTLPILSLV